MAPESNESGRITALEPVRGRRAVKREGDNDDDCSDCRVCIQDYGSTADGTRSVHPVLSTR